MMKISKVMIYEKLIIDIGFFATNNYGPKNLNS